MQYPRKSHFTLAVCLLNPFRHLGSVQVLVPMADRQRSRDLPELWAGGPEGGHARKPLQTLRLCTMSQ